MLLLVKIAYFVFIFDILLKKPLHLSIFTEKLNHFNHHILNI